jgi:predicted 3-demethylubiquinone-9 3-methyltransferase (glyoxalase superfamily)
MQKITPFLWFDNQAEEAVNFYTSIFKNSKILGITRYEEGGAKAAGRPKGSVMTVVFKLEGQEFIALNGGPVSALGSPIKRHLSREKSTP